MCLPVRRSLLARQWVRGSLVCRRRASTTLSHHSGVVLTAPEPHTGIARLTLTNARRTNPLSLGLMRHVTQLLRDRIEPSEARVLVLDSEPGRFFSSGHDLQDVFRREGKTGVEARSEAELRELFGACTELMLTLRNLRQPTVAVVDGHAASAGLQLVASCDIVLASTSAQFSAPGSRRGRFCHTPGVALVERVGASRALEMLLLGSTWSAEQALAFGLVSQVFAPEDLADAAQSLAESLSVGVSAQSLAHGKRALRECSTLPDLADKYRAAEAHMAVAMSTRDAVEGTKAMLENRQPRFST